MTYSTIPHRSAPCSSKPRITATLHTIPDSTIPIHTSTDFTRTHHNQPRRITHYRTTPNTSAPHLTVPNHTYHYQTGACPIKSEVNQFKFDNLKATECWTEVSYSYQPSRLLNDFVEQIRTNVFGKVALKLYRCRPTGFESGTASSNCVPLNNNPSAVLIVPILGSERSQRSQANHGGFEQIHRALARAPGVLPELRSANNRHPEIFTRKAKVLFRVPINVALQVVGLLCLASFCGVCLALDRFDVPSVKQKISGALDRNFSDIGHSEFDCGFSSVGRRVVATEFGDASCLLNHLEPYLSAPSPARTCLTVPCMDSPRCKASPSQVVSRCREASPCVGTGKLSLSISQDTICERLNVARNQKPVNA